MSEVEVFRKERVLIDESVAEIYRELRADANSQPEQSPFTTNKDIFMLAACLGYRSGQRQVLPSGKKLDIRESVFLESDLTVLKAIAIADTGDVAVLSQPGEILKIAEEYAHAGMIDVRSYLLDDVGRPLWNLLQLVTTFSEQSK